MSFNGFSVSCSALDRLCCLVMLGVTVGVIVGRGAPGADGVRRVASRASISRVLYTFRLTEDGN